MPELSADCAPLKPQIPTFVRDARGHTLVRMGKRRDGRESKKKLLQASTSFHAEPAAQNLQGMPITADSTLTVKAAIERSEAIRLARLGSGCCTFAA